MEIKQKILVVASHPDDEILGCGGTLSKHVQNGDEVYILFLTDGVGARNTSEINSKAVFQRKKSALSAAICIGAKEPIFGCFPDNQCDSIPLLEIVKFIENKIKLILPSTIYTHYAFDLNIDHRIAFQAVMTAARADQDCPVQNIYSFEIPSSTEWASNVFESNFTPNFFVNIESFEKKKVDALKKYNQEIKKFPHPRSFKAIKALSNLRGAQSGFKSAEAFFIVRQKYK